MEKALRNYLHRPAEIQAPALADHVVFGVLSGTTNVEWNLEGQRDKARFARGKVSVIKVSVILP